MMMLKMKCKLMGKEKGKKVKKEELNKFPVL